jgi:hypothetical protein
LDFLNIENKENSGSLGFFVTFCAKTKSKIKQTSIIPLLLFPIPNFLAEKKLQSGENT